MKNITITLTCLEIRDLAQAAGFIIKEPSPICDKDDEETEYTITEKVRGVVVGDEDGKNPQRYLHGAHITEYPEEGTYPLGNPITL